MSSYTDCSLVAVTVMMLALAFSCFESAMAEKLDTTTADNLTVGIIAANSNCINNYISFVNLKFKKEN